jgi:hypothetical protein
MISFRLINTAVSRRMMSSHIHEPITNPLKAKFKVPSSVGQADMETKLWAINPGLAVAISGAAAFVAGMGVHVLTRGTPVNTNVRDASLGN